MDVLNLFVLLCYMHFDLIAVERIAISAKKRSLIDLLLYSELLVGGKEALLVIKVCFSAYLTIPGPIFPLFLFTLVVCLYRWRL